jgi:hypothetical protein
LTVGELGIYLGCRTDDANTRTGRRDDEHDLRPDDQRRASRDGRLPRRPQGEQAGRRIDAPAHLYEDSARVKAIKVGGLLKAREDLRDLMMADGVTADRIEAMGTYTGQLIGLGWTPE